MTTSPEAWTADVSSSVVWVIAHLRFAPRWRRQTENPGRSAPLATSSSASRPPAWPPEARYRPQDHPAPRTARTMREPRLRTGMAAGRPGPQRRLLLQRHRRHGRRRGHHAPLRDLQVQRSARSGRPATRAVRPASRIQRAVDGRGDARRGPRRRSAHRGAVARAARRARRPRLGRLSRRRDHGPPLPAQRVRGALHGR